LLRAAFTALPNTVQRSRRTRRTCAMKCIGLIAILVVTSFIHAGSGLAAQLSVEPVLLELNAPTATGTLTLRNDEDVEATVQTRVFRWSQIQGIENLEPTTDVVASPPAVRLAPHSDYTVRVVRTATQPVGGEESYRVIVDQLPNIRRQSPLAINILIRQSIPVFFRSAQLTRANVSWSLAYERGKIVVTATNSGDERLRIASLRLRDATGSTINFGNGLVGYVLGRSSMSFTATSPPRGFAAGGPVSINAESNNGPVHAAAALLQIRR
jgi:fimbrial chaperone protein